MSQITIQCRLVASESSRHQLWKLMAELNTPLINELLRQVSQHPSQLEAGSKDKVSTRTQLITQNLGKNFSPAKN